MSELRACNGSLLLTQYSSLTSQILYWRDSLPFLDRDRARGHRAGDCQECRDNRCERNHFVELRYTLFAGGYETQEK